MAKTIPTTEYAISHLVLFVTIQFWETLLCGAFCIMYSYKANSAMTATHTALVTIPIEIFVAETAPVATGSSDAIIISIRTATDVASGMTEYHL